MEYPPLDADSHADASLFAAANSSAGVPLRAIIVSADPVAAEQVRSRLESEPGLALVAECQDGAQTISAIRSLRPDLVIVDIDAPGVDGFQAVDAITPGHSLVVIFTSPDRGYTMRAFETRALEGPLKQLDELRLRPPIEKTRFELPTTASRPVNGSREPLARSDPNLLPSPGSQNSRLLIKARGRIVFVNQHEIDWIEAASNYVRVRAGKEWHVFRGSISRTQERLDPNYFIRIHRSTIVNVRKIKELIPVNGSEYVVVLTCGKELSCGRGHRAALQRVLDRCL